MLKLATGTIEVKFTLDQANEYNELVKRNSPKAVSLKVLDYEENGEPKHSEYECCPACGRVICEGYKFCPECGQRLDGDNFSLTDKK